MNFRETFEKQQSGFDEEVHANEILEIRSFRNILNDYYISQLSETAVKPEDLPSSPFKAFEVYLKTIFEERGLSGENFNDYAAFHLIQGSTPPYTSLKGFDLFDGLIRNKFKEFVITQYPQLFEAEE